MNPSPWRKIAAREVQLDDTISVVGITNRRSCIMRVTEVERTHERQGELVLSGRQPWGGTTRGVIRHVDPNATVELLVLPNVASDE